MTTNNDSVDDLINHLSKETGIPVDELKNVSDFKIAASLMDFIHQAEVVLTYMGPDKFYECLSDSMILKTVLSDESLSESEIKEKSEKIKQMVKYAVDSYYNDVIQLKIKHFIKTMSK